MTAKVWYKIGILAAMPAVGCGVYLLTRPQVESQGFWTATPHGPVEWAAFGVGTFFVVACWILVFVIARRAEKREKLLDH